EKEHFTVYGTSGCGHTVSYAVCPSGSTLVSGGYQLTAWSQDNRNPFNSPDSTYPDWANNRWIVGGTGTITSCFRSERYAPDDFWHIVSTSLRFS
ncbi:TPA: hypothetical protein ACH9ZI_005752, partial [Escherichia coli]